MSFIQWLWTFLYMHHVKIIISNTCALICSPSYLLTESCAHYVFLHCFQGRSIWFTAGRDRVSMLSVSSNIHRVCEGVYTLQ